MHRQGKQETMKSGTKYDFSKFWDFLIIPIGEISGPVTQGCMAQPDTHFSPPMVFDKLLFPVTLHNAGKAIWLGGIDL